MIFLPFYESYVLEPRGILPLGLQLEEAFGLPREFVFSRTAT